MKRSILRRTAGVTCALITASALVFTVSADSLTEPHQTAQLQTLDGLMTSMGISTERQQALRSTQRFCDKYIRYFNLTQDQTLLSQLAYTETVAMHALCDENWATYDGYSYGPLCLNVSYNAYWSWGYGFLIGQTDVEMSFHPAVVDFPNLLRLKYTTMGNGAAWTDPPVHGGTSSFSSEEEASVYFVRGVVTAGAVLSTIASNYYDAYVTTADVQRILTHYNCEIMGIPDPTWTDAATVSADVNFDGIVDTDDAIMVLNYLNDSSYDFW